PLPHVLATQLAKQTPSAQLIVTSRENPLVLGADEHLRYVIGAESQLEAQHAGEYFLTNDERVIDNREITQAYVAGVARPARPRLAKVLDKQLMAACDRCGIRIHFFERREGGFACLLGQVAEHSLPSHHVSARK